jgi:ribosomal-protein-alanine N-acetyltransferase
MNVREMCFEDVPQVFEIEKQSFLTPWSKEAFEKEILDNKFARYTVVENNGEIVAYGGMWWILDEAHVTNIAVHNHFRKQGIGRLLVDGMIKWCKRESISKMTLEVRVSNDSAIKLYEKFGFIIEGKRKAYYTDTGEDAYIMWCAL